MGMMASIKKFSARDQEVITLRYGAGLPVQQIALIMNLTEDHVSVLLHRAVNKIKKSLEEVSCESQ